MQFDRLGECGPSRIVGAIALEPFVGDREAGDIGAQALEFLALSSVKLTTPALAAE